jgi:hypothetical protein
MLRQCHPRSTILNPAENKGKRAWIWGPMFHAATDGHSRHDDGRGCLASRQHHPLLSRPTVLEETGQCRTRQELSRSQRGCHENAFADDISLA